jgi:hypothetical protein
MPGGHKRPKLFPQLVNRFTCRHPVLTKPAVEPREDCVSPIMTPHMRGPYSPVPSASMTNGPVAFARKPAFLTMLLALAAGLQPGRLRALQPNQRPFKIDLMPQRICASVFAYRLVIFPSSW